MAVSNANNGAAHWQEVLTDSKRAQIAVSAQEGKLDKAGFESLAHIVAHGALGGKVPPGGPGDPQGVCKNVEMPVRPDQSPSERAQTEKDNAEAHDMCVTLVANDRLYRSEYNRLTHGGKPDPLEKPDAGEAEKFGAIFDQIQDHQIGYKQAVNLMHEH